MADPPPFVPPVPSRSPPDLDPMDRYLTHVSMDGRGRPWNKADSTAMVWEGGREEEGWRGKVREEHHGRPWSAGSSVFGASGEGSECTHAQRLVHPKDVDGRLGGRESGLASGRQAWRCAGLGDCGRNSSSKAHGECGWGPNCGEAKVSSFTADKGWRPCPLCCIPPAGSSHAPTPCIGRSRSSFLSIVHYTVAFLQSVALDAIVPIGTATGPSTRRTRAIRPFLPCTVRASPPHTRFCQLSPGPWPRHAPSHIEPMGIRHVAEGSGGSPQGAILSHMFQTSIGARVFGVAKRRERSRRWRIRGKPMRLKIGGKA